MKMIIEGMIEVRLFVTLTMKTIISMLRSFEKKL